MKLASYKVGLFISEFSNAEIRPIVKNFGSGIEVRVFRWAGEARPSENPYKFRTTKIFSLYGFPHCPCLTSNRYNNGGSTAALVTANNVL